MEKRKEWNYNDEKWTEIFVNGFRQQIKKVWDTPTVKRNFEKKFGKNTGPNTKYADGCFFYNGKNNCSKLKYLLLKVPKSKKKQKLHTEIMIRHARGCRDCIDNDVMINDIPNGRAYYRMKGDDCGCEKVNGKAIQPADLVMPLYDWREHH